MGFSLNDIQKGTKKMPRKVIIYGPPKLGKSTLAGSAKNAIMIPTEDRVSHIDCDKTPVMSSYWEILDVFDSLLNENNIYKTIIIDTADWLEPLIHDATVEILNENSPSDKKIKSITDDHSKETSFARGLKYHAVESWKKFLKRCDIMRDNGFNIIILAHDQVIKVDPPNGDSYDKSVMKIDKHALAVLEEWADVIAYYDKNVLVKQTGDGIKKKGKAVSGKQRVLHLSGDSPAMISGNSFGLPTVTVDLDECEEIIEWILTGPYEQEEIKK
jgi:hypothetical protein